MELIMNQFEYPKHFVHPADRIYFTEHIPIWESKVKPLLTDDSVCLEIGALYGAASVYMIENFCKGSNAHFYIMDLNTNTYIESNIAPYKNVSYLQGLSEDTLRGFKHRDKNKEFLDLVYIDGNHMAKHVLEDAVNAFYYLKPGGIMVFDDYGWGLNDSFHRQPKTGIDAFIYAYRAYLEEVHIGWQVILRRNNYDLNEEEKEQNYYTNWNVK